MQFKYCAVTNHWSQSWGQSAWCPNLFIVGPVPPGSATDGWGQTGILGQLQRNFVLSLFHSLFHPCSGVTLVWKVEDQARGVLIKWGSFPQSKKWGPDTVPSEITHAYARCFCCCCNRASPIDSDGDVNVQDDGRDGNWRETWRPELWYNYINKTIMNIS